MAKSEVALAKESLPAGASDFEDYAGAGMENVTSADLLVPRLVILQALSPHLKKRDAAYIEGAEVGNICEVGTGELFKDGVLFLPVYYRKDWLEWAPRDTGKGLVAVHNDPSILERTTRNDKKQPVTAEGNIIVETAQFFGLNLTADRRPCFLPMTSTQLKKSRKWLTLAQGEKLRRADGSEFQAPLFYRSYNLTTADESNAQGDWSGWVVNRAAALPEIDIGVPWQSIKEDAIRFRKSLIDGEMRGDLRDADKEPASDADGAM